MLDEHESKKDGGMHAGLASLLGGGDASRVPPRASRCRHHRAPRAAASSDARLGGERLRSEEGGRRRRRDEDDAAEEDDENDLVERDAHVLASAGATPASGRRRHRRHEAARLDVSLSVAAKAPRAHVGRGRR